MSYELSSEISMLFKELPMFKLRHSRNNTAITISSEEVALKYAGQKRKIEELCKETYLQLFSKFGATEQVYYVDSRDLKTYKRSDLADIAYQSLDDLAEMGWISEFDRIEIEKSAAPKIHLYDAKKEIAEISYKRSNGHVIIEANIISRHEKIVLNYNVIEKYRINKSCITPDGDKARNKNRDFFQKINDFFTGENFVEQRALYNLVPGMKYYLPNAFFRGLAFGSLFPYVGLKMADISTENIVVQFIANSFSFLAFLYVNNRVNHHLAQRNAATRKEGPLEICARHVLILKEYDYESQSNEQIESNLKENILCMNMRLRDKGYEELDLEGLCSKIIDAANSKKEERKVKINSLMIHALNEIDIQLTPGAIRYENTKNQKEIGILNTLDGLKSLLVGGMAYMSNFIPYSKTASLVVYAALNIGDMGFQAARYLYNNQIGRIMAYLEKLNKLDIYYDEGSKMMHVLDREAMQSGFFSTLTTNFQIAAFIGGISGGIATLYFLSGNSQVADLILLPLLLSGAIGNIWTITKANSATIEDINALAEESSIKSNTAADTVILT